MSNKKLKCILHSRSFLFNFKTTNVRYGTQNNLLLSMDIRFHQLNSIFLVNWYFKKFLHSNCYHAVYIEDHPWLQNAKKAPTVNLGDTVRARLQQFSVMNKLKKKALRVRTCHVTWKSFFFFSILNFLIQCLFFITIFIAHFNFQKVNALNIFKLHSA